MWGQIALKGSKNALGNTWNARALGKNAVTLAPFGVEYRVTSAVALFGILGIAPAAGQNTLQVVNNCSVPIWIQQINMPAPTPVIVRIDSKRDYTYTIPASGPKATRFWPKTGCDGNGNNCAVGQSSPPCPTLGCLPAIDSKLEVSWGSPNKSGSEGQTFYDLSQVDGFTLPYSVTVTGGGTNNCTSAGCPTLDMTNCITSENLTTEGHFPELANQDLTARQQTTRKVVGCFSPAGKLTFATQYGAYNYLPSDPKAGFYTCRSIIPSSANPIPKLYPGTALGCRAGPAPTTKYVQFINSACTGVYGYAYDDINGTRSCIGPTQLVFTICP